MIKKLTSIIVMTLLFVSVASAQWVNEGIFPTPGADTLKGQLHGIAVDPAGKIWAGNFGPEKYVIPGTTDTLTVGLIRVFNPDGTPATISPIWGGTLDGVADTNKSNIRGMATDHQGNIIIVDGARVMRRFNYQTGALMNRVVLQMTTSPIAPGVDTNGHIFVGPVVNAAQPIEEYDADFNFIGTAVQLVESGFTRAMEVSKDGNTIYFPVYSADSIRIYTRADEFAAFELTGAIFGPACESIEWNEATNQLWFSGGSYNDMPDSLSPYTPNTWYAYDFTQNMPVDSLKWTFTVPMAAAERPRAIDFSPDGKIAYFGCFGGAGYPLMQKAVNQTVGVERENSAVVNNYTLDQNYPNPFNPSTTIKFSVVSEGMVTLRVFNLLGEVVSTLVSENLSNGNYTVNFDASQLSSGTYVYELQTGDVRLTKKMMLMK